ncbi:potassium uptake TrkH family protein [Salirhabdus euzebyi]|uniref:Potassium uptake TrkH family protein n=1 Tax=Salirhabdus euzebyi TaxID=394506 RepID=A0A841Q897_9BACI|nr:TrkH family potassium uptake protein [Salirhabdus euzebyi]MBB6454829.1 potassium uptake TrkH family protein [Salirhabdus euzebyi]
MDTKYKISHWLGSRSPVQLIAIFYLVAVTVSCILLSLPLAHKDGTTVTFMEVLFTSVSAVSVTGLSVVTIVDTFSNIGLFILAFVFQFGGLGVMTLGTFIWILVGKKIGLRERRLIMTDQNQTSFQGMVRLMRGILKLILIIELIGFLILGTYFLRYFPTWQEAYFQGFFASISATTNAGFDITGQSLIPFQDDYFVQFIHITLIILGSIGFPVLIEVKDYLTSSPEERKFMRFSLFTKLTTLTYFSLIIFGFLILILLEWNHFFAGKSWHEVIFYSLFQSTTTRSGGLSTMDVSLLTEQSQLFISSLMFIGASPSSVGGGIRTTTFALVIIFIMTFARGKNNVTVFRREVHEEDLFKAVVVTLMALIICFVSVVFISIVEEFSLISIIFEVSSAFGTTGLSMGITSGLSPFSQIVLMILMFIGRIGILTFLFTFNTRKKSGQYHYPKERIIIG